MDLRCSKNVLNNFGTSTLRIRDDHRVSCSIASLNHGGPYHPELIIVSWENCPISVKYIVRMLIQFLIIQFQQFTPILLGKISIQSFRLIFVGDR